MSELEETIIKLNQKQFEEKLFDKYTAAYTQLQKVRYLIASYHDDAEEYKLEFYYKPDSDDLIYIKKEPKYKGW